MAALQLTPSARKDQRALAHHLDPVVFVGGDGLTPGVAREIDLALDAHGLIKVRVFSEDRRAREAMLAQLSDQLGAAAVQHIGKLLVLWRPLPPKDKSDRESRGAGPKLVKIVKFSKSGNHRPQVKKIRVLGNQRITAGGELKRARKRLASPKKAARP
jgi:RNA-binding protein